VAHVDLAKDWETDTIRDALNAQLRPNPIAILNVERVAPDFDARFSARARHYLYRIVNRRADLALDRDRVWRVVKPLDANAMHEAAQRLVGHHDFTTFRSTECQAKSPVKTLDRLGCFARRAMRFAFEVSARSFLHNQVRSMVGSLVQVGEGKWSADEL
jgi:tRNA pseudouridine38-40 synthase